MSVLIGVSNLTNFQEFSTSNRKPVDNPAALGALSTLVKLRRDQKTPPQAFNLFGTY